MNIVKQIKLSKSDFIVEYGSSSLKLDYRTQDGKYIIDITNMNLINATKIAILCSTYCFINNFKKKICWLVADEEIKKAINILRLNNIESKVCETNTNRMVIAS